MSDGKIETAQGFAYRMLILTIQKSVSLAKFEYVSIVERTLNIRQTSTSINLKRRTSN